MSAHNSKFPWASYYGHYNFFESRIGQHGKVIELVETDHKGLYMVKLADRRVLRVFVCECYSFGVAEYQEVVQNLGRVDAVVINSAWCGYTPQAKEYLRGEQVGVFSIAEFMGALNLDKIWTYMTPAEREAMRRRRAS